MELGLQGQCAVITGASKGIGRAVAELFAAEGCHLHLAARSQDDLSRLADTLRQAHGVEVAIHALDLSEPSEREVLIQRCSQADILVNNAGDIPGGGLESFSDATWRTGWELKVFGFVDLTRGFYAAMKQRGRGVIVNIIGLAGVKPDASYIAGTTGNAGLIAFTKALGGRSVDFGVRVVGINPSLTDTPRGQRILRSKAEQNPDDPGFVQHFLAGLPFGRMCSAEEIAAATAFLASKRAAYISGTVIDVDGGSRNR